MRVVEVNNSKYKVSLDPFHNLCELIDGEWKDCEFNSMEEAEKAMQEYVEFEKGIMR